MSPPQLNIKIDPIGKFDHSILTWLEVDTGPVNPNVVKPCRKVSHKAEEFPSLCRALVPKKINGVV